jgi:hypothetical protein
LAFRHVQWWRRGELNRPQGWEPPIGEVPDYPAKSATFSDFPKDHGRPKTARKDPNIIPKNRTGSGWPKRNRQISNSKLSGFCYERRPLSERSGT